MVHIFTFTFAIVPELATEQCFYNDTADPIQTAIANQATVLVTTSQHT